MKIVGWSLGIVIFFITLYNIGIPNPFFIREIDGDKLLRIKKAGQILVIAQLKAQHESVVGLTQFLTFEYGRITDAGQIDNLFPFLAVKDRDIIKSLFNNGDIKEIDMHEQSCIRYTIKSSWHRLFLSTEALYLYHNNRCTDCLCENLGHSDREKIDKKSLGNGWFLIDIVTEREPYHG
ncbi:MAG: hypothetical protein ACXVB0_13175 [Mucilaginibacter sp.]